MQLRPAPAAFAAATMVALMIGCSDGGSSTADVTSSATVAATSPQTTEGAASATVLPTTAAPTTVDSTTTAPPSTLPPATAPTATLTPATVPATVSPASVPPPIETRELGASVEGRPITAARRGTAGGRVVLVIGVIHGDENDGLAIMDRLHVLDVPADVDLWLVDSMNPDGVAAEDRHNANQVDLNRNFPFDWGPLGVAGDGQYAGPAAASEPETQAMVAFITEIRPDLVIWYHQDLFRISPSEGRVGAIKARYAELTGLPVVSITGGTYTGVAATWARNEIAPGVAFIVELGPSLSDAEADTHAEAVLTIAAEPN